MSHSYPIIDLHQDLLCHINRRDLFPVNHWQTNFEMIEKSAVKLVVATAFPVPPEENFLDPVSNEMIEDEFHTYAQQSKKPGWTLIQTATDVDRVLATDGPKGLLMHIEGLNVVDAQSWERLERWYDLGWRSLGIVWNVTNPLGGGTLDPKQGLTSLGTDVIEWCKEKKMVIDFAHMNEPTFWDVAKLADRPIYVSHGNCRALCDHPRNYSDQQLKAVAESGGVVGLFLAKSYLTGKDKPGTIADAVAHAQHLIQTIGDDHLALGTDFGGIITGFVDGLNSLETLPLLLEAFEKQGWSDQTIEKICSKNAARVLKAHLI